MTTKTPTRRKRASKGKKHQVLRKSFVLDADTLADLAVIQSAMRATSTTEAIRRTVSQYAKLVRHASKGKLVQVVSPKNGETPLLVDVPRHLPKV
jgi:hypothetical protein